MPKQDEIHSSWSSYNQLVTLPCISGTNHLLDFLSSSYFYGNFLNSDTFLKTLKLIRSSSSPLLFLPLSLITFSFPKTYFLPSRHSPFSVHSYQGDISVRGNSLAHWEQTFSMSNAKFVPEAARHFMITDVSPNPCQWQTWHQFKCLIPSSLI